MWPINVLSSLESKGRVYFTEKGVLFQPDHNILVDSDIYLLLSNTSVAHGIPFQ